MKAGAYRSYLLVLLLVIMAFNYVDRLALGVLLQDIKRDLRLTDTELGFLSGIAFASFYSLMGIPIARWADRGNRVAILTTTTALWSAAVASCGLAANYAHLLLIRVGVAVGEAGCVPTAHSLIADYFERSERARAVSFFKLGIPLSALIGYFAAGWLNELYGWRMTFILLGLPGLGLAVLARLTLREPRHLTPSAVTHRAQAASAIPPLPALSLKQVGGTLWRNRTYRNILLAYSIAAFFATGAGQWKPAFFIRSYGLDTGNLGTWLALISGGGGLLGTLLGGFLASRYAAHNERLQLRVMSLLYGTFGAVSAAMYLASTLRFAFALMAVAAVGAAMNTGPLFAILQTLIPERMRATSVAVLFLSANLIGLGFGPLLVGILSDAFAPWAGKEALRYALLALCPGYLWGAWHLALASRTALRDLGPSVCSSAKECLDATADPRAPVPHTFAD